MYKNLKISNSKGLKEAELSKLGRLNVFCGRNSSGKSSVLEGINGGLMSVGIVFDEEKRKKLKDSYRGVTLIASQFLSDSVAEFIKNVEASQNTFGEVIDSILTSEKIYYSENKANLLKKLDVEFFKSIRQKTNKSQSKIKLSIAGTGLDTKELEKTFESLFANKKFNHVLLPPKRLVQPSEVYTYYTEVKEYGELLLSKIFSMKNQTEDSPSNSLYKEIKNSFYEISSGYQFDVVADISHNQERNVPLLGLKLKADFQENWIDAKDCGLGFRDLLLILYFAKEPTNEMILIEEPENHIHPEMQRKLLRFLKRPLAK